MSMLYARLRASGYSPLLVRLFTFTFVVGLITSLPDILFNFYLLSMGFDNAVAGSLASILRLSGFVLGIPLGLAVDRIGGVRTLQIATVVNMLVWGALLTVRDVTSIQVLYFLSGVFFTAQAISIIPMIARVSTPVQRPMLFGVNFSVLMATSVVSALIGGRLPQWCAQWLLVDAMSDTAYRTALYSIIGLCVLVIWVLWGLESQIRMSTIATDAPVVGAVEQHIPVFAIILRSFGRTLLGFAGGIFIPFINIFLRQQYNMPDATVGTVIAIFALGSTLGGLFVGRVMERFGSRAGILYAGSIAGVSTLAVLYPHPWLFTLVFSLCACMVSFIFPLADVLLMGMIAPGQRGIATSVSNMMWSLGWAVAAWMSGLLQVASGFFWPITLSACAFFLVGIWFYVVPFPRYHPTDKSDLQVASG
ncbi:MAG: hypothetical protein RL076_1019 [Chloroflexota bacterium]|jgi:MFS family permease